MESQFTKAYTIQEVSKMIHVPSGTLRQWEKDLKGLLIIPRTNQGARFYTDQEIGLLSHIKQMRDKNLSKDIIREMLRKHLIAETESETSLSVVPDQKQEKELNTNVQAIESEQFFAALETYKENLLIEVKEVIRNEVLPEIKKEIANGVPEIKKEIANGSLQTVKSLTGSIYKASEKTTAEINELTTHIQRDSELTSEWFGTLSDHLAKVSEGTSEEIKALMKRISESSDSNSEEFKLLMDYLSSSKEDTRNELVVFTEMLNRERDYLMDAIQEDRIELNKEIKKREEVFQDLVDSFREAAAAKKQRRNWWRFWE